MEGKTKKVSIAEFGALPQIENNAPSFHRAMKALSDQGRVAVPPGVF